MTTPEFDDVADVARRIAMLSSLPPLVRVREARVLTSLANAALAAAGDAAVMEAVAESGSQVVVARDLGVSESAVGKAAMRHRARQKQLPRGIDNSTTPG